MFYNTLTVVNTLWCYLQTFPSKYRKICYILYCTSLLKVQSYKLTNKWSLQHEKKYETFSFLTRMVLELCTLVLVCFRIKVNKIWFFLIPLLTCFRSVLLYILHIQDWNGLNIITVYFSLTQLRPLLQLYRNQSNDLRCLYNGFYIIATLSQNGLQENDVRIVQGNGGRILFDTFFPY